MAQVLALCRYLGLTYCCHELETINQCVDGGYGVKFPALTDCVVVINQVQVTSIDLLKLSP